MAVPHRGGHLRGLDHLMTRQQVAQLLGVLAALILRAREAEEALSHHAQRIDRHDREGDDHQTGRETHRLPHPNETEIHGG